MLPLLLGLAPVQSKAATPPPVKELKGKKSRSGGGEVPDNRRARKNESDVKGTSTPVT